jgi:hypothetical protein
MGMTNVKDSCKDIRREKNREKCMNRNIGKEGNE